MNRDHPRRLSPNRDAPPPRRNGSAGARSTADADADLSSRRGQPVQKADVDNTAIVPPRVLCDRNPPFDPQNNSDRLALAIGEYLLVNAAVWLQGAIDEGKRPFREDGTITDEGLDVMIDAIHFFADIDDEYFVGRLMEMGEDIMSELGPL